MLHRFLVPASRLVELPADVAAGSTWSGSGSANDVLDYWSQFRAAAAADDCLEVTGEFRYTSKDGRTGRTVTRQRTWCPDRGPVAAVETYADLVTRTTQTATGPPRTPDTSGTLPRWRRSSCMRRPSAPSC